MIFRFCMAMLTCGTCCKELLKSYAKRGNCKKVELISQSKVLKVTNNIITCRNCRNIKKTCLIKFS